MDILHWKQKDFSGRKFVLRSTEEQVGVLDFKGWSSYDATYRSENTAISFTTKGWFEQKVIILYNGEKVGEAITSALGKTQVCLTTGEVYNIKSQTLSYNRTVVDAQTDEPLIFFEQPVFSFGKGSIKITNELPALTKEVLVATSLYLKAVSEQQVAVLIVILMPIFIRTITN